MAKFNDKATGNQVSADDYNNIVRASKNTIENSGQTIDATNTQLSKAVANYSAVSTFYTDSGTANAYILTPIGSFESPHAYTNGMLIRFRPANANTGAATVNINSLGVKNLKKTDGSTDLDSNDLKSDEDVEFRYDGTSFVECPATANANRLNLLSNKNLIINGDFNIWRRGDSFTSIVNNGYSADRFVYDKAGSMIHDISKSDDVPTVTQAGVLFNHSIKIDCTTADTSIAAGDFFSIQQKIEGYNFAKIAQRQFTVSFWIKSNKTGTYSLSCRNSGSDRSFVSEFTIDATSTWEKKTITIDKDKLKLMRNNHAAIEMIIFV